MVVSVKRQVACLLSNFIAQAQGNLGIESFSGFRNSVGSAAVRFPIHSTSPQHLSSRADGFRLELRADLPRSLKFSIMPKSKRARIVPTSKTKKDRKELVRRLHANIQSACDQYDYVWVFEVDNVRNSSMKQVRSQLSDSRYAHPPLSFPATVEDDALIYAMPQDIPGQNKINASCSWLHR